MPSILPGFEYDIFVSYRQKDNKYDGWVTEFVANLKKEIEATFKEDVSIYFDANPHDGLLETHQVSESLEGKLNCLIFIPIISQTYCDLNSFAWQHEFRAFNKRSMNDQFGRDIKLPNGNVSSRILPVKIHELDEEDKAVLEEELGGVLRPIEFIYKSYGVNRPLRASEERPLDNLNKTNYRDQINKVANSVKEIIGGLKKFEEREMSYAMDAGPHLVQAPELKGAYRKWMPVTAGAVLLLLVSAYFFVLPKLNALKDPGTSGVAVLPFRNYTGDETLDFYGVGMASEIGIKLSTSKHFGFISSLEATLPYENTRKSPREIGNELNVDYLLSGLYQKAGNRLKIEVELVDASTGQAVWKLPVESELLSIFDVQALIAGKVLKQFSKGIDLTENDNSPTRDLEAYIHYIKGTELNNSPQAHDASELERFAPAIFQFQQAVKLDSGFIDAWVGLISLSARVYLNEPDHFERKKIDQYVTYVNKHFGDSWQKNLIQAQYAYRVLRDFDQGLSLLNEVLEKNPNNLEAIGTISGIHRRKLNFTQAIQFSRKALSIDPGHSLMWDNLGDVLRSMGDKENAAKAYLKAWTLSNSRADAMDLMSVLDVSEQTLENLPDRLKKEVGTEFTIMKLANSRDWEGVKRASLMGRLPYWTAVSCTMLGKKDSAKYWAKFQVEMGGDFFSVIACYAILGERQKAFALLDKAFEQHLATGDDLEAQSTKLILEVYSHMLLGERREATEKLLRINSSFPDFGNYSFLMDPLFDGIKQEYPPFSEAVNNLKIKPFIDISKLIKL